MKRIINKKDIIKANNIERCQILLAIIKRTSSIYTRYKNSLKEWKKDEWNFKRNKKAII